MYVIGIDPGPVTGAVRLKLDGPRLVDAQALQTTPGLLQVLLESLAWPRCSSVIAWEAFVVGPRAGRSATASAGKATRDVVGQVSAWAADQLLPRYGRSASEVKPWATDKRLDAAGLLDITHGMRHARDAARHALYCAVRDHGLTDPLSRKAGDR